MSDAITVAVGIFSPFLIQLIKNWSGWKKKAAYLLTFAISIIIAIVLGIVFNQLDLKNFGVNLAIIITSATTIYNLILKK